MMRGSFFFRKENSSPREMNDAPNPCTQTDGHFVCGSTLSCFNPILTFPEPAGELGDERTVLTGWTERFLH